MGDWDLVLDWEGRVLDGGLTRGGHLHLALLFLFFSDW